MFCPLKNKQQIKVISAYFLNIFVKAPLRFVFETQNISKHKKNKKFVVYFNNNMYLCTELMCQHYNLTIITKIITY